MMTHWHLLIIASLLMCSASSKFTIDWSTCEKETACFLLRRCVYADNPEDKLVVYTGEGALLDPNCPLGLQLRFLNDEKTLYLLQINMTLQTKKVEIYHGNEAILSCENENSEVVIKSEKNTTLNPKLYEDLSRFDNDIAVCAFITEKAPAFAKDLDRNALSIIRIDEGNFTCKIDIWYSNSLKVFCDPDLIEDLREVHGFHALPLKYKAGMSLDCSYYNHEAAPYDYHLYIEQADRAPMQVAKIDCSKSKKQYIFTNNTVEGTIDEPVIAYCAVKVTKMCKNPLDCNGLCTFTPGDNTQDASIACKNNKWLIKEQYYEGINPVCKANSENQPTFFMTYPDGMEKELTEGQCFDTYDCVTVSKLDITECAEGRTDCGKIVHGNELYCDAPADYEFMIYSGNTTLSNTPKFECDSQTGLYKSATNQSVVVAAQSRVVCRKTVVLKTAKFTTGQTNFIAAGSAVAIAIVVVAIGVAIRFTFMNKKLIRDAIFNKKEWWKRLPPAEKLSVAQKIFGSASLAQCGQDITILEALKLLDVMLECETEEPEVWETAEPFLKRFHSIAFTVAPDLEKMFGRYCYLQAKKIIDKHGWTSQTKITRTNYAGYIRVCAIRLLAFARRYEVDAQKMVLEGFKQLRFNGVEQYPHCGFLWAVVTQQRVGVEWFHRRLFRKLRMIVEDTKETDDIPIADRFPHMASIRHQASFALGASEVRYPDQAALEIYSYNDVSLTRSFLKGTLLGTCGNSPSLFRPLIVNKENSHKYVDRVFKEMIIEPTNILENILTTMIFQWRLKDAKNTEETYLKLTGLPAGKESMCHNFRVARLLFISALEEEKKSILHWLSLKIKQTEANEISKQKNESEKTSNSQHNNPTPVKKASFEDEVVEDFVAAFDKEFNVPRIRTCPYTEAEQFKLRGILASIMCEETVAGEQMMLGAEDVVDICHKVRTIFESEPVFIEDVPTGVYVVADLHGQLYDLVRIFDKIAADTNDGKPGYETGKYLFLGDYVDRGIQSLEVIMTLFILKILYPDRFTLLRGNHEFLDQNRRYSKHEFVKRYTNKGHGLYVFDMLNETYAFMSICAVIGGKIFCAHGGISGSPITRHELRLLKKPILSTDADIIVQDMLWSDPMRGLKGFVYNTSRGAIFYGEDYLERTLKELDCICLIRGHQMMEHGIDEILPNCISLFSITAVDSTANKGAFCQITDDLKCRYWRLGYDQERWAVNPPKSKKDEDTKREISRKSAKIKDQGSKIKDQGSKQRSRKSSGDKSSDEEEEASQEDWGTGKAHECSDDEE